MRRGRRLHLHKLQFNFHSHKHTHTMENATAIKILQEAANIAIKAGCFGLVETTNIINALATVEKAIGAPAEKAAETQKAK